MVVIGSDLTEAARAARAGMLRHMIDDVLRVTPAGDGCYRSPSASSVFDRVYGGQILAQALLAAAATVPDGRQVHSAHCYYLRLGDPDAPISYAVETLRDTRAFSSRLVSAEQQGGRLAVVTLSFSRPGGVGISHQWPMPDAPPPEAIPSRDDLLLAMHPDALPMNAGVPWPIDIRYIDRRPWEQQPSEGRNRMWLRAEADLPDDPVLHAALLLYASDLTMYEPVVAQHPVRWEDLIAARGMFGASLDHAFWLHENVRADEWVLHVQESSRAAAGRGLTTGRFYDMRGRLVASVAQEMFVKENGDGSAS